MTQYELDELELGKRVAEALRDQNKEPDDE
jgi:hypothetical protein